MDAVSFTGSADTAMRLRSNMDQVQHAVRFAAEQDSLNASVLGPDVGIDDPEFDLFIKVTRNHRQGWTEMHRGAAYSGCRQLRSQPSLTRWRRG